jgi:glucose/arabinose dehydrogenase
MDLPSSPGSCSHCRAKVLFLFFVFVLVPTVACSSEEPSTSGHAGETDSDRAEFSDTVATLDYKLQTEVLTQDLEAPWAIDFLGPDTALVTEEPGRLRMIVNGDPVSDSISGTPEVSYKGVQGGLLDVAVDPNYEKNGWVYLSYAHGLETDGEKEPAMIRVVRGRIQNHSWKDQEVLFEAPHDTYRTTRHQFGSRIAFDEENRLYFSIGDRGDWPLYPREVMMQAQELNRPNGKIHRINRDGSIPAENPFVGQRGVLESIFSYGHRNPQGLALHPETGRMWATEHGPRGGDELNRLKVGANYGWPEIVYGINYNGSIITRERRKQGMEQPMVFWRPSIAVSGLSFYDGEDFPYWQGQLLVSSLKAEELRLLTLRGEGHGTVMHQEVLLEDAGRVREAVPGPEGSIYVIFDDSRLARLSYLSDYTERK